MCFCYDISKAYHRCKRALKRKFKGTTEIKIERPESLVDLPESDSSQDSSEEGGAEGGLTMAAKSLGEG